VASKIIAEALGYTFSQEGLGDLLSALRDDEVLARRFPERKDGSIGKTSHETTAEYWADKGPLSGTAAEVDLGRVEIDHASLMRWLSGGSGAGKTQGPGRPATIDWDSFWIEIVTRANGVDGLDGISLADMAVDMQSWFENIGGHIPNERTIRKKLEPLYERLGPN